MLIAYHALADELRALFARHGFTPDEASACTAEVLEAEWLGKHSHGLAIVEEMLTWNADAHGTPEVTHDTVATALVEGHDNVGPVVAHMAMDIAIAKANTAGIGMVGARNKTPFLLTAYHPRRAARRGLLSLAATVAAAKVAPYGGTRPVFGTNPIAMAIPCGEYGTIAVDMAATKIPAAEIRRLHRVGGELPRGVALDASGSETTDPGAALGGAMLPFGGAKGSALALMVEVLAGALLGAKVGTSHPGTRAMLFIAIDPNVFGSGDSFPIVMRDLVTDIHASGIDVHVPGEAAGVDLTAELREVDDAALMRLREL